MTGRGPAPRAGSGSASRRVALQREARELGQRLRTDAEREAAQTRHEAFGEAERIVGDARSQVSTLEGSIAGLRAQQDEATAKARELVEALTAALERHSPRG